MSSLWGNSVGDAIFGGYFVLCTVMIPEWVYDMFTQFKPLLLGVILNVETVRDTTPFLKGNILRQMGCRKSKLVGGLWPLY